MGHMGTHAASVPLYPKLSYNPATDFVPIGMAAGTPIVILGKKDFPPKDLKEFAAYLKANSDKLNSAHAGVGSVSYSANELLNSQLGIKPVGVPFNGTGPAMSAPVRCAVSTICSADASSSLWSYALRRMRMRCLAISVSRGPR